MKRTKTSLLCILILTLTVFSSCTGTTGTLKESGEEVIDLMLDMLGTSEYHELYNLPASTNDALEKLQSSDFDTDPVVYEISVPTEKLLGTTLDKDVFSPELYTYLSSSAYSSFASRINQAKGSSELAIAALLSAQKTFAGDAENTVYLYVFESGCPIAVSFISSGNGTYRALGNFILDDTFGSDGEAGIVSYCEALGIDGVSVKKR